MKRFSVAVLLLLVGLAVPRLATAGFLFIDDTNLADQIVFNVNDFENGFSVNGSQIQYGLGNPVSVPYPEADALGNPITYSFSGSWIDFGQTTPGSFTILFAENGNPDIISDILTYTYSGVGDLTGTFVSDVEGGPPLTSTGGQIIYTESWDFSAPFLSASAQSDVSDTPEPATFGLVVVALGALSVVGRRKAARS